MKLSNYGSLKIVLMLLIFVTCKDNQQLQKNLAVCLIKEAVAFRQNQTKIKTEKP